MSLPAVAVSQTPESRFREFLASRPEPRRFTTQHRELVRHIFARHKHFDTKELLEDLKAAGKNVSRPTVYRTLNELDDAGLLRKIPLAGRRVYEHDYGYPQHDHLYCQICDKLIEFSSEELQEIRDAVAREHNFRVTGHRLIISGVCEDCSRKRHRRQSPLDLI